VSDQDRIATPEPLLEVSDLVAGYGGAPVLEEVGFAVRPGERVGVLGPNGGGKSTLFRVLLGELEPSRGIVRVRGRRGIVPQTERSRLDYPVSALDVALMGTLARLPWWRRPSRSDRRGALEALETVGLRPLAGRSFGELSGGQRQRTLIARALVQDAQLLLLDEPFAGVDEPTTQRLMSLIDRLADDGRSVMIATHDVEQARRWDRVLCLNRNQIAFGPPEQTLTRAVLEATHRGAIVTLPTDGPEGARTAILPAAHHDHEA
jgi:ABC-type Mn2+/Zn2+ transport system ATPase subunit